LNAGLDTKYGIGPNLTLDLTVNILTNHAVNNNKISVFGGDQKRPNIHIEDVTDLYIQSLEWPEEVIDGNVFNAGYDNQTVLEIAGIVKNSVSPDVEIATVPTDDHRSYHPSRIGRFSGPVWQHLDTPLIQARCVMSRRRPDVGALFLMCVLRSFDNYHGFINSLY